MFTHFLSNFSLLSQHQNPCQRKKILPEGSDDNSLQKVAIKQNSHTDKSHCRSVSLHGAETDFLHDELILSYVNGTEIHVKYTKQQRKCHPLKIPAGSEEKAPL